MISAPAVWAPESASVDSSIKVSEMLHEFVSRITTFTQETHLYQETQSIQYCECTSQNTHPNVFVNLFK